MTHPIATSTGTFTTHPFKPLQEFFTRPSLSLQGCLKLAKGAVRQVSLGNELVSAITLVATVAATSFGLFSWASNPIVDSCSRFFAGTLIGISSQFLVRRTLRAAAKWHLIDPLPVEDAKRALKILSNDITKKICKKPFFRFCILPPLIEEVYFRVFLPELLLIRLPIAFTVLKKVVRGLPVAPELLIDMATPAKTAGLTSLRICIGAGTFSLAHSPCLSKTPATFAKVQMVVTLVFGFVLGSIEESSLGLMGAIGAHFINNYISLMDTQLHPQ